jgi:hypothetical protein
MNVKEIKEWVTSYNDEALLADGFEDAIIGMGQQHGSNSVVIYDRDKCIEILAKQYIKEGYKKPYLDAEDFFGYNVECAYVGKNTPIFMQRIEDE